MDAGSRLALFVCSLALAGTAGWAVGRVAGFAAPQLAGSVPGFEHLSEVPGHGNAPLVAPGENP